MGVVEWWSGGGVEESGKRKAESGEWRVETGERRAESAVSFDGQIQRARAGAMECTLGGMGGLGIMGSMRLIAAER